MPRLLIGPVLRHVGSTDATIWVETDEPCTVEVAGAAEHTWTVFGHHYALVHVEGLAPGSSTEYDVTLDGAREWPPPGYDRPAPRIRTQPERTGPLRIAFGSCRYGRAANKLGDKHFDPDSLAAKARTLYRLPDDQWPDAFLMLGDQVYADETSEATQRRIRARRDIEKGAKDQVADFEEYTWLYLESWTDPDVRWLMSCVPSSMIFDDHDVRDDWNTSHEWREEMQRTDWWEERIVGGLASYWVYQHLGNCSPAELADDATYQKVRAAEGDAAPVLREFAANADREADGAKGTQWSYRRDFGRTRLLMIDSRCGRILADGARMMVSEDEFRWIETNLHGDYDHLLIGTSLPWLLAPALQDLESWNEALCDGQRGPRGAKLGEKIRRAADLEHWASFRRSYERLADLLAAAGRGEYSDEKRPPTTISVLSGDVHHAYAARAHLDANGAADSTAPVYQLVCSPLHNYVPGFMKVTFRGVWTRTAERIGKRLLRTVQVAPTRVRWERLCGPYFGSEVATLSIEGTRHEFLLEGAAPRDDPRELVTVATLTLSR